MEEPTSLRPLPVPGDKVGRYEIVAELAHGGMAVVFVLRADGAGGFEKLFAMKMMLPHLATERRFVDMFVDEARLAAQIHHSNVVQVFDFGVHGGLPYMVMELLRGQSLARIIRKLENEKWMLDARTALAILAPAAEGLAAAHETCGHDGAPLGVVHRDVSPQNIHVGYDGHVKVLDFGVAAAAGRISSTQTGEIKGTFPYLAPEQITRDAVVDRRADIWALGVLAWELLSGRRLFAGEDNASTLWNVLNRRVPHLATISPEVPVEVAECVMSCLERRRERRPRTSAIVAEVFRRAEEALRVGAEARELADLMQTAFANERVSENQRIAAALTPGLGPVSDTAMTIVRPLPTDPSDMSEPHTTSARARPFARVAVVTGLTLALAAAALALLLALGVGAESPRVVAPVFRTSGAQRTPLAIPVAAAPASPAPQPAQHERPSTPPSATDVPDLGPPPLVIERSAARRHSHRTAASPGRSRGATASAGTSSDRQRRVAEPSSHEPARATILDNPY